MKADFEPWWQFEGWQENIVEIYTFSTKQQFLEGQKELLNRFRMIYNHEAQKEGKYYAFWKSDEIDFCESCDDDLQIYHGLIFESAK